MINKLIQKFLLHPSLKEVDIDDNRRIEIHNKILSSKKMMKDVFEEFYRHCLESSENYFCKDGLELEIGSGVSFFKSIHPKLITSDIIPAKHLDLLIDAQNMHQIEDNSLKAIYAINVFHHFSSPRLFFNELMRVLKPGGGCVLIEPYYGLFASQFYKHIHSTEHFNPNQKNWESEQEMGVMTNANQALSYIVFVRDKNIFQSEYPNLEIILNKPLDNYLRYLFSGGLNFRQILPYYCNYSLIAIEKILIPVKKQISLHNLIIIRKSLF